MKTKNFNLLFYLKKIKNYESGELPIYLRISVDGRRSEATIGRGIEPEKWDEKRGKARGNTETARSLNAHLDSILAKLKRIHTQLLDSEEEITADILRNEFDGKGKKSKMLLEIFRDHNKQMESLIGKGFGANTLKTFKSSFKNASEFIEWKFMRSDYELRKVDFNFIKKLNPVYTASSIDRGAKFKSDVVLLTALKSKDFLSTIDSFQPKSKLYVDLQSYMRLWVGQHAGDCYEIPESLIQKMAINMERLRWISTTGKKVHLTLIVRMGEVIEFKDIYKKDQQLTKDLYKHDELIINSSCEL